MSDTSLSSIDIDLLAELDERGRNVARNLAQITEYDRDRINDRLLKLSLSGSVGVDRRYRTDATPTPSPVFVV